MIAEWTDSDKAIHRNGEYFSPPNEGTAWEQAGHNNASPYRLVSLFAPAPKLNVELFWQGSYGQERFYWSEPATSGAPMMLAGIGSAAEIIIPPVLETANDEPHLPGHRFSAVAQEACALFARSIVLPAHRGSPNLAVKEWQAHPARPRLFGGFAFQDDFVPDNTWSVFSPAQFILPHYQFVQTGGESYLTINALVSTDEDFSSVYRGLSDALQARLELLRPADEKTNALVDINYPLPAERWAEMIDRAKGAIRSGELKKVVLARVCEVRTENTIDAAAALPFLNRNYGDCYRFIFEPVPHHAFFGATPELLVRKDVDQLGTMALAGSTARGLDPQTDAALGQELLASAKNRHEHQLVVNTIRTNLRDVTSELEIPSGPTLLKLQNIQHLLTPISGRLRDSDTSVLSLAGLLHPTPAMGGVPAGLALSYLSELEPVPRGWYASPIGWLDAGHNGEFAVAIRSAVSQHARAWLYAGAGIVGDSDAGQEWAETALKFRPMLGALGIGESVS